MTDEPGFHPETHSTVEFRSARDDLAALLDAAPMPQIKETAEWMQRHGPAVLALIDAAAPYRDHTEFNLDTLEHEPTPLAAAVSRLTGGHDE